jgi:hypothetical protein
VNGRALKRLRSLFRGELVLPSDKAYETTRRVCNASIDKPGGNRTLLGRANLVRAVECSREHELLAAVRGGAHNVAA